jgi:hypothetical protein
MERTWNVDPSAGLKKSDSNGGERREIGQIAKASYPVRN